MRYNISNTAKIGQLGVMMKRRGLTNLSLAAKAGVSTKVVERLRRNEGSYRPLVECVREALLATGIIDKREAFFRWVK